MNEGLFEILTDIDDSYIAEAAEEKKRLPVMKILAAAAALAAVIGLGAIGANYLQPEPAPVPEPVTGEKDAMPEEPPVIVRKWRYMDELPKTGDIGVVSPSYILMPLTEEEIFRKDTVIFKGTVTSIRNIEIDYDRYPDDPNIVGIRRYRAVVLIEVSEVYRGELKEGETVSLHVNCPIDVDDAGWAEDQDTVSKLRVGMTGIFMPRKRKQIFSDGPVCDYEFPDGERFAFLDTPGGVTYDKNAYPSLNARNLDDVEAYIRLMLLKQLLPWG